MSKVIDFNTKELMVKIAGSSFWYWNTFYSFLESCGIPSSLYKQYGKEVSKYEVMRSILSCLESQQKNELIINIAKGFYNFKPTEDNVDKIKALKTIEEFRKIIGTNLLEEEINQKEKLKRIAEQQKIDEERRIRKEKLDSIKLQFLKLTTSANLQQRGYDIEAIFYNLLNLEEIECKGPYKTHAEQIDGHFKYEKFDYLVEIKWTTDTTKQIDLSIFDGKIRGKAQSTRGLLLSVNGFDENGIKKFSGDAPRIILMDGLDLMNILEERISFYDLMKFKTDEITRKGNIYGRFSSTI